MSENGESFSKLAPQPIIIETIKGKKGDMDVFVPLDLKGKPMVPVIGDTQAYDNSGIKKKPLPVKGKLVDTKS